MTRPGAHRGQWGTAEAGAWVCHVHACRGGSGWVQVDVAVDGAHGAHGAQTRVHGAGRGIHLETQRNTTTSGYLQENSYMQQQLQFV